jgi:hypothetical protein
MNRLVAKTALATVVALAAQLVVEAANAQDYRGQRRPAATQRSYDAARDRPSGSRFTPEEQKIIDGITARGWKNGY